MPGFFEDDSSMYKTFTSFEEDSEDGEFLKSLYPPELVKIQLLVEDECDKLEYDGSIMFDQYPDKVRILKVIDRIEENIKRNDEDDMPDREYKVARNLLEVMVINEVMRRRMRRRHCRLKGFC